MTIEFHFLADRVAALPIIAKWYFDQWGHLIADETISRSAVRLQSSLNRGRLPLIRVATLDHEVVGAAQLKFHEMEDIFPAKEYWIGGVYVAKAHRGQGIGSRIVEDLALLAPHYGISRLHLQTEQLDGGLYTDLGWKPTDRVNNHGLEVLIMERQLKEHSA